MRIESGRFGTLDITERDIIRFPNGLIGFPKERAFLLLRKSPTSPIGWLQSTSSPKLALPVVSVESLANRISIEELAAAVRTSKLATDLDGCAVMAVLCVPAANSEATVNLLAPIIVNTTTRKGLQVILENSKFTTSESFCLQGPEPPPSSVVVKQPQTTPRALDARP